MDEWMQLSDGAQLFFMKGPDAIADTVTERHVAHGLSLMCRYAGQCCEFFSVAEHSALMAHAMYAWLCKNTDLPEAECRRIAFACLMHDATEAFLPDIPRPLKVLMPDYLHMEAILMDGVLARWPQLVGLIWTEPQHPDPREAKRRVGMDKRVKEFDNRILVDEKARLMGGDHVWATDSLEPLRVHIRCLTPVQAEAFFMQTYELFSS